MMSKPNETRRFWKELGSIFILFVILDLLIFFGLKWHYNRNFSFEKMQEMITANSKFKEVTDDPCKWAISGDPWGAELSFIKLNVYCSEEKSVSNTLDLKGIKGETYGDLIREYAKIQGINLVEIENSGRLEKFGSLENNNKLFWTCFINRDLGSDLNDRFKARDQVDCFYTSYKGVEQIKIEFSKTK